MLRIVPEIRLSARLARLRALVSRFKSDRRGNVAVITAIAALPMISAIGCVIDYSNASMIRTKLQAAADAASLATVSNNSPILATAKAMVSNGSVSGGSTYATQLFRGEFALGLFRADADSQCYKDRNDSNRNRFLLDDGSHLLHGDRRVSKRHDLELVHRELHILIIPQFLPDDRRLRVHEFPFDAVRANEIDGRQSRQSRPVSQRLPVRLSFYRAERLRPV